LEVIFKMLMEWRLADAKNRFSEVVSRALTDGPQRVLRRDGCVIIVAEREYEAFTGKRPGFKEFLLGKGPTLEDVEITRDRSPMRDTKL
jgi:antitoxin Phd